MDLSNTEQASDSCEGYSFIKSSISESSAPSSHTSLSNSSTCASTTTHDDSVSDDCSFRMTTNAGFIALGTVPIRHYQSEDQSKPQAMMFNPVEQEPYPNTWMTTALRKGWIRVDEVSRNCKDLPDYLRIFVLPEDVGRGNRGSLKDFRKVIRRLLNFVDRSNDAWLGMTSSATSRMPYETPRTAQEESLFFIFNTLQSPSPNLDCFHVSTYGYQAVSDIMNDAVLGLRTQLYPYQRRSVAAMIQREAEPAKILDPRKPIYKDIFGVPFYLDVTEGALHKNPSLYTEPRGGILAETMGYGKTLICIALILATRGHYPKVPEDRIDSVPFRPREKVGSLLAMAARRTKHEGLPWKAEFNALRKAGYQFDRCIEELKKYEREYAEPIFTPTTPDRKGKRDSANIIRLCSATLIIVPPNLLVQWQHEIKKHTETDAVDVLVIDAPAKEVPPWQELLKYDTVLITKARFEQEYRDDDLHQGKARKGEARYQSPLTQVRWLRVICDEGHGFAGSSSRTNAMAMLDKMYIERRWVVSGTPSSTLHGVEVGISTTRSSSIENARSSPLPDQGSARKESLSSALEKRRTPSVRDLEAKDLERLRLIVVNFLRLQPWANQRGCNDAANWKKYLSPTVHDDGTYHTSPALRDVLQTLIVRHRIEDIDTDLTLPPLHNRTVYLEPSYHDKLAINMFFLVLTSNYVTSEREDEDYMFHPRNRKKLDQLINNLRQASFHWVGFSEHDIRETLRISNEYLDKNIDKISDADALLLTEAIMNGERALADPSWRAFSTLHEIGVYVNAFPAHAREAWALDGRSNNPVLLGTVQAREAQRHVRETFVKGAQAALFGFAGAGIRAMNAAKSRAEDEQRAQQKAKTKLGDGEKQQVGATEEPKLKTHGTSLLTHPVKSSGKSKSSVSVTPKKRRRNSIAPSSSLITPPISPTTSEGADLLTSPLPTQKDLLEPRIVSFTSSKLTYLISRLLTLPSETRSLVFYQHNNTAFFIAEALELLSIPFRIYANTLSVAQRNAYLADFNSADSEIRVLLMDVKQASHGLHVACASYVCIVSPIWDASVESQAVKRAHRIGQTKEVVVETLVLQDTFEEEMVRRRRWREENLNGEGEETTDNAESEHVDTANSQSAMEAMSRRKGFRGTGKSLLDDRHMVNVLKDIKFMKFNKAEREVGGRAMEMENVPHEKSRLFDAMVTTTQSGTEAGNQVGKDALEVKTNSVSVASESDLNVKFKRLRTHAELGSSMSER